MAETLRFRAQKLLKPRIFTEGIPFAVPMQGKDRNMGSLRNGQETPTKRLLEQGEGTIAVAEHGGDACATVSAYASHPGRDILAASEESP